MPFNCVNHPLNRRRYVEMERYGNSQAPAGRRSDRYQGRLPGRRSHRIHQRRAPPCSPPVFRQPWGRRLHAPRASRWADICS